MTYAQQLYQLQQIDSQIDAARRRLKEIEAGLVENAALKSARAELATAEQTFNDRKALLTDLDLEVKGLQQKANRHEERLYSGRVINPKEAASLQDEVASLKRWLSKREEDLLEAMINLEEAEAALDERRQTFSRIRAEWQAHQAQLRREQEAQQIHHHDLAQTRQSTAQLIDDNELARYEQLRRQKGGVGLAVVKGGNCLSCGVMLSSRLIQQAGADNQLYFCDSCGRIIHIL